MKWYLAQIIFRVICGEGHHCPQFDEHLRLIKAGDEEEAYRKAVALGLHESETFFNQHQQLVQWQFIDVASLTFIGRLDDGTELCSRIQEVDDADAYLSFVADKSKAIRQRLAVNRLTH